MAYVTNVRVRHRPALSGIQSRPAQVRYTSRTQPAMGTLAGPHTLGDDATQTQILASINQNVALQQAFNDQDKRLRYIQIATTAAIPLFAAAWRAILGWRRGRVQIL